MMFQPQRIICPCCLRPGLIITEDIRDDNRATRIWKTLHSSLITRIVCPHCSNTFEMTFEPCKSRVDEVLYKCIDYPNAGLYMWKNMGSGNPKLPVYRPHARRRTYPPLTLLVREGINTLSKKLLIYFIELIFLYFLFPSSPPLSKGVCEFRISDQH